MLHLLYCSSVITGNQLVVFTMRMGSLVDFFFEKAGDTVASQLVAWRLRDDEVCSPPATPHTPPAQARLVKYTAPRLR